MAAEFSLNTQMILLSKRMLWLSDGSMGFGQESDTAFSQGKAIISIKPLQKFVYLTNATVSKITIPCVMNISVYLLYSPLFLDQSG